MIVLDKGLSLEQVEALLYDDERLVLSEEARKRVEDSYRFLSEYSSDKVKYKKHSRHVLLLLICC